MNNSTIKTATNVVTRRIITASAVRRLHSDIARHKKSKKALPRMKKERDDEQIN